ncbi:MAG: hypothetical protein LLG04_18530 [Parachlamydia sp.]|nr:hypothetical protein [Parachlamydia sp.]
MGIRNLDPARALGQLVNKMENVNRKPCRNMSERVSKKSIQICLNVSAVVLGITTVAKDIIVLAGIILITPVKLEIMIVRIIFPDALKAFHKKLDTIPSPVDQMAHILVDVLSVAASTAGVALCLFKGSQLNVAMQKGLYNVPLPQQKLPAGRPRPPLVPVAVVQPALAQPVMVVAALPAAFPPVRIPVLPTPVLAQQPIVIAAPSAALQPVHIPVLPAPVVVQQPIVVAASAAALPQARPPAAPQAVPQSVTSVAMPQAALQPVRIPVLPAPAAPQPAIVVTAPPAALPSSTSGPKPPPMPPRLNAGPNPTPALKQPPAFPKPSANAMPKIAAPPVPLKPASVPAPSAQAEASALMPPPPPRRTASVGSLDNVVPNVVEQKPSMAVPLPPPPPPRVESSAGSEGQFPVSSQALLQAIREKGSKNKSYVSPSAKKKIIRTPTSARSKFLAQRRRAIEESPTSDESTSPFTPEKENKTNNAKSNYPVISPIRSPRPVGRTFKSAKILTFDEAPNSEKPPRKFSAADLGSQKTQLRKKNNPGETPRKRTLKGFHQKNSLTRFFNVKPGPSNEASLDESPTP